VDEVLAKNPDWVKGFTLVIAHNLEMNLLEKLSTLLWEDEAGPPLVVVKSAGFLAEFFIQFRDHSGGLPVSYSRIPDWVLAPCSHRIPFRFSTFSAHNQPLPVPPLACNFPRFLKDGPH
jgi:hypothetical protein